MLFEAAQLSKIVVFLINVVGVALLITVLLGTERPILKRIFLAMTLLMFTWVNLAFLARLVGTVELGLVFIRVAWSIAPLVFILIFSFVINFEHVEKRYRKISYFLYAFGGILFFITLFTQLFISDIFYDTFGILNIGYGSLIWLFFGSVAVLTFIDFLVLLRLYKESNSKAAKVRIRYLIVGLTIFFLANAIFNIFYPVFVRNFSVYEFGDYSLIIFLSLIAYVIIRHEMFGIKVAISAFVASFLGGFLLLDAALFSTSTQQALIGIFIFIVYVPFGYLLVKGVLTEVSQRAELERLNEKLKELDRRKDEFISVAAHELRAPMTAIKGYLSMISEGDAGEVNDEVSRYLTEAIDGNERLIRLVNNMLNISRIEENRLTYEMGDVKLAKVAKEVYSSYKNEADQKELQFELHIENNISDLVRVDKDRIYEVVSNLVSNAIKYTDNGSVKISLKNPQDNRIRFEVKDTGPGITAKERKKLFNKFYRAQSSIGKKMGTGLGLYISKLLIEKFGGKIDVMSVKGEGSVFWFELTTKPRSDKKIREDGKAAK